MGIVFDEVVGRVDPEQRSEPQSASAPPEPATSATPQAPLEAALRRLHQRQARLRAD